MFNRKLKEEIKRLRTENRCMLSEIPRRHGTPLVKGDIIYPALDDLGSIDIELWFNKCFCNMDKYFDDYTKRAFEYCERVTIKGEYKFILKSFKETYTESIDMNRVFEFHFHFYKEDSFKKTRSEK